MFIANLISKSSELQSNDIEFSPIVAAAMKRESHFQIPSCKRFAPIELGKDLVSFYFNPENIVAKPEKC